ncbi:hypothetical protein [Cellulomonas alba]|uniref:Uncharacterized protein n=1 Tax=Cellulomonas alba TaxID=3053467 RepID=A0ABT7SHM0_9CELL|nr:hypothetical protein [Cellulomonas alba]MDM7855686.1 hypothetical protein [Cellulomonas alba]
MLTTGHPGAHRGGFADGEPLAAFVRRTWLGYGVLAAALVRLAVASEHLSDHALIGVTAAVWGAAELGWAGTALRGPLRARRTAFFGLALGAVGWVLVLPTAGVVGVADAVVVGLELVCALVLAVDLRLGPRARARPVRAGVWGRLGLLALGALVAALITVPTLATTEAGAHATMPGMGGMPGMSGTGHH